MATMISVYFLAIVLVIALVVIALGGVCDRLEKIADHLRNIDLELAAQRHDRRANDV